MGPGGFEPFSSSATSGRWAYFFAGHADLRGPVGGVVSGFRGVGVLAFRRGKRPGIELRAPVAPRVPVCDRPFLHRQGRPLLRNDNGGSGRLLRLLYRALSRRGAPHRLQKSARSSGLAKPHAGQVPGGTNVVPHRVQNFEFSSTAGFPQAGQAMGFLTSPPHLSQNCACGSATIAPQLPQTGNCGSGSSTIADPHRLQNFDSLSGAGVPHCVHFLAMYFLKRVDLAVG